MFFATTLLISYYVYAVVGEKYLECSTADEKFFLPKKNLIIQCTLTMKLKHFSISQINLLFNNRSWAYSTNLSYTAGHDEYIFNITRESLSSEHTVWLPKEPWKVYSEVVHSTGKITEFQGSLLDHLTEPILQWSLGTPVNNLKLKNSSFVLTQSTCALDVVIIVPLINSESQINFGVTKKAFTDGNIQWFSMLNFCQGCEVLDLVLVNHYLLILMENKVFKSNFLIDGGNRNSTRLSFTEVFNIPNCMSVKKGQLIYTPQCRYHIVDDFQDDIIVLLYQCQTTSHETVTNVYMSSSATNFSKWTTVGDFLKLPYSLSALAFNPQTDNLIMIYESNSVAIAEVHHVWKNLSVQASTVHQPFHFPADKLPLGLFIHPISNFLYAYGEQVWVSSDDGLSFELMPSPVTSDKVEMCKPGYSDGCIACVTTNNKIIYSKASPGRIWNVEPHNLSSSIDLKMVFFDYMENLYVGYLENGQMKTIKVDVIDGINRGSLQFSNPLMVEIMSDEDIDFYEYRVNAATNTNFSVFSMGMLLTSRDGGSFVIRDLVQMSGSLASNGFLVKLCALVVGKLTSDHSNALSSDLNLETWNETTYEGEVRLASGSWAADDVWKTVVVPYTASFLVSEVNGPRAKVKSMTNIRNMQTVKSGKWKMFDFAANSWSLKEDKCRHSLQSTLGISNNYAVVNLDLRMLTTIQFSLGLSAPFAVGSDSFLYGYLTNPSIFRVNFYPSFSVAPLLEKLTVKIMPIVNRKSVTTLRVFAVGASMLCQKSHVLITIYGACPSAQMLAFIYPNDLSRENFLPHQKVLEEDKPVIDIKPNYRPPSHLGYSIPTSDNIYNADPSLPRPHEDFKISKETGRLKQCARARTRKECGCTDRMMMTDDARYSDCKVRAFRMTQPAVLETNFSMKIYGETIAIPANYLIRIVDVNNRSIRVQYKKGASASPFSAALRSDNRFSEMATEYFEPYSIEIVMEGSGLYHLRAEIMKGLSFCPLYSEFQVYVTATRLQYPVPFVLNFIVALVLGGILFVLVLWYLMKHHYSPAVPATGSKCRYLNMKGVVPLHPPYSLPAVSLSMGDQSRLSSVGEQASSTELLDSAKAEDLISVSHPKLSTGPQHEHAA